MFKTTTSNKRRHVAIKSDFYYVLLKVALFFLSLVANKSNVSHYLVFCIK